ncbi:hypothetical protein [Maribacter stanieri]|uniref:hypothetical protein n=1 Tax=Maribacter stanieri TaxID=440514 RepID=UPI0030D73479|tara:strand:+ start:6319 stop:6591 length:273 start_codon:yes stop_codon:yes gene_type:complete
MSKIVFQNHDIKAIKLLLKEIGKERYDCALKDAGIIQKPLSMTGFYVEYECDTKNINLYHKYPSNIVLFIMSVLGFWRVPHDNWQMIRKK